MSDDWTRQVFCNDLPEELTFEDNANRIYWIKALQVPPDIVKKWMECRLKEREE